jgi:hypothetical protein
VEGRARLCAHRGLCHAPGAQAIGKLARSYAVLQRFSTQVGQLTAQRLTFEQRLDQQPRGFREPSRRRAPLGVGDELAEPCGQLVTADLE